MKTPYFAAVYNGNVYGVGNTKKQALEDAELWSSDENISIKQLKILPCTEFVYFRVKEAYPPTSAVVYIDKDFVYTKREAKDIKLTANIETLTLFAEDLIKKNKKTDLEPSEKAVIALMSLMGDIIPSLKNNVENKVVDKFHSVCDKLQRLK